MRKIDYIKLHIYLFFESILWTLTDLVRARRMRLTQRMHDKHKPAVSETDQTEATVN